LKKVGQELAEVSGNVVPEITCRRDYTTESGMVRCTVFSFCPVFFGITGKSGIPPFIQGQDSGSPDDHSDLGDSSLYPGTGPG